MKTLKSKSVWLLLIWIPINCFALSDKVSAPFSVHSSYLSIDIDSLQQEPLLPYLLAAPTTSLIEVKTVNPSPPPNNSGWNNGWGHGGGAHGRPGHGGNWNNWNNNGWRDQRREERENYPNQNNNDSYNNESSNNTSSSKKKPAWYEDKKPAWYEKKR